MRGSVLSPCEASPSPLLGPRNQPGTERIPLHVPHDRQQVPILFDWKRLESPLPDPTRGALPQVVTMTVRRQEPLHPATDVVGAMRRHHKMKMVGHQADGEDGQFD